MPQFTRILQNRPAPKGLLLVLVALILASPALRADGEAATVIRSSKQVEAIRDNASRALQRKDPVFAGEQVRTGDTALASMRFTDGSVVTLDAGTELNIREYRYTDGGSKSDSLVLELASGSFRSLTGAISKVNPDAYTVKTPLASLSIRGTFYLADVDPVSKELAVFVWEGRVVIKNEFGSVSLGAGEGAVTQEGQPPVRTDAFNALSALSNPLQLGAEFLEELPAPQPENDTGETGEEPPERSSSNPAIETEANASVIGQSVGVDTNPEAPESTDEATETGQERAAELETGTFDPDQDPLAEVDATTDVLDTEFNTDADLDLEDPDVDISFDPADEDSGQVFAPGLDDEGREIGADRIIDNL